MAATLNYITTAVTATDGASITFSGQSIGTAAADRKVVVAIGTMITGGVAVSSVTIGGITANINQAQYPGQSTRVVLAEADVPTGTTADIVITSAGNIARARIFIYTLNGVEGNANFSSDFSNPYSITQASAINGTPIIGVAVTASAGNPTWTWTGITEDGDGNFAGETGSASSASLINNTASPIAATTTSTGNFYVVAGTAYWDVAPEDPPENTVLPVISLDEGTGELSTTDGTWLNDPTLTYQWQVFESAWADISGETSSTYTPTETGEYRCVVIGTGSTVVEAKSLPIIIEMEPDSPTPYSVYTLNGNKWPRAGEKECEAEIESVANSWENLCRLERANTIYFHSELGDDSNDGISLDRPKKTIGELNSIQAPNTTYKLCGTFRTGTTLAITADNCTITKWDGKDKPRITGLRLLIEANSGAWTNASGDRWTTTLTNATSLHRQDKGPDQELKIAASTAEVESNVNSYFISSNVISVNIGGDPNLVDWECNTSADYGSSASGITINAHGVRIDNVICDHNGFSGFLTSLNQSWGIQAVQNSDKVVVITDCECYGHRLHNIGHLVGGAGGGRTLFKNCRFGGCTHDQATQFVDYADNGENEFILIGCTVAEGRSDAVTLPDITEQRGFYAHTNGGSNRIGFGATVDCSIDSNAVNPVQDFGNFGNAPNSGRILNHCRAIHIRANADVFDGHRTVPFHTYNVFISSYFHIKPKYSATLAVSGFVLSGFLVSSTFDVDWSNVLPPASATYGLVNGGASPLTHYKIINSEIRFKNGQFVSGRRYSFTRHGISETVDKNTIAINSIFTNDFDVTGAEYVLNIGNDESTDAIFNNNAVYGWTESDDNWGYSGWTDTLELDSPVDIGTLDSRTLGFGVYDSLRLSEINRLGSELVQPGQDIGPWGLVVYLGPARATYITLNKNLVYDAEKDIYESGLEENAIVLPVAAYSFIKRSNPNIPPKTRDFNFSYKFKKY